MTAIRSPSWTRSPARDGQAPDDAAVLREHRDLHLHRLEQDEGVPRRDGVALGNLDAEHGGDEFRADFRHRSDRPLPHPPGRNRAGPVGLATLASMGLTLLILLAAFAAGRLAGGRSTRYLTHRLDAVPLVVAAFAVQALEPFLGRVVAYSYPLSLAVSATLMIQFTAPQRAGARRPAGRAGAAAERAGRRHERRDAGLGGGDRPRGHLGGVAAPRLRPPARTDGRQHAPAPARRPHPDADPRRTARSTASGTSRWPPGWACWCSAPPAGAAGSSPPSPTPGGSGMMTAWPPDRS